jgi:hypothetical protein
MLGRSSSSEGVNGVAPMTGSPGDIHMQAAGMLPPMRVYPSLPGTSIMPSLELRSGGDPESSINDQGFVRSPGLDGGKESSGKVVSVATQHRVSAVPMHHAPTVVAKAQSSIGATLGDSLFRSPVGAPPSSSGTAPTLPNLSSPISPAGSAMPGAKNIDVAQLANRVYELLVRRLSSERERRGA